MFSDDNYTGIFNVSITSVLCGQMNCLRVWNRAIWKVHLEQVLYQYVMKCKNVLTFSELCVKVNLTQPSEWNQSCYFKGNYFKVKHYFLVYGNFSKFYLFLPLPVFYWIQSPQWECFTGLLKCSWSISNFVNTY